MGATGGGFAFAWFRTAAGAVGGCFGEAAAAVLEAAAGDAAETEPETTELPVLFSFTLSELACAISGLVALVVGVLSLLRRLCGLEEIPRSRWSILAAALALPLSRRRSCFGADDEGA